MESLPERHANRALAAATAGDSRENQVVHNDILSSVTRALTVVETDPKTGERAVQRPTLEQKVDGVGVWDRARPNVVNDTDGTVETHPEHPASLSETQISRLAKAANSDRIDVTKAQVGQLRARLDNDVIGGPEGRQRYQTERPALPLVPALEQGPSSDQPLVNVTRISVSPDSYGSVLDAEVLAAATGTLAVVAGTSQGTPDRLVVEGAEELAERAPHLLTELDRLCAKQEPPVALTLVFTGPTENMAQFVRGERTLLHPGDSQAAEYYSKALPKQPMTDVTGTTSTKGAHDDTNVGRSGNKGFDPEKVRPQSGTSTSSGAARGANFSFAEATQVVVRPPYAHELMRGIGSWQAAHWDTDGNFEGVFDLRQRGARVAAALPNMQAPTLDVRPDIHRIERDQERDRAKAKADAEAAVAGNPSQGMTSLMPPLPSQPRPPAGAGPRSTRIADLPRGMQLRELSAQTYGRQFQVDRPLLANEGIDEWTRQTAPDIVSGPNAQQDWVRWCQERDVGARMAAAAWQQRWSGR